MNTNSLKVFAPATVANVAAGFDIFGFAIDHPGDEIVVRFKERAGVSISLITGEEGKLPLDPKLNSASASLMAFLSHLKTSQGFEIEIHKKMPLGSGLGSSAASSAGSVFAANLLLKSPLSVLDLIPFAMEGEKAACSILHADNVAPALLGGFTLIRSYNPLEVLQIKCPLELYCIILHPKIEILTSYARKIIKPTLTLDQHVIQTGNATGLVLGLMKGDAELISRCLQDVIIEPVRSTLIPGFAAIKDSALKSSALGCSISGSGPSLFALTLSQELAETIGHEMVKACEEYQPCDLYLSKINYLGPRVI